MGVITKAISRLAGMPKKAERRSGAEVPLSPEEEVKRDIDAGVRKGARQEIQRERRKWDEYGEKQLLSRAFARVTGKGSLIKRKTGGKGGGSYTLPGGVTYRIRKVPTSRGGRTAGRPRQSFKLRVDPFTGKLIRLPALEYYKLQRRYNMMLRGTARRVMTAQEAALARRGVPPSVASQIIANRQAQIIQQAQPVPMQQPMPSERQMEYTRYPSSSIRQRPIRMPFQRPIPVMPEQMPAPGPRFREEVSLLTGKKVLKPVNNHQERWLYD